MITYLAEKETAQAERVGYVSLVGVRGDKFPLNHGNYFSLLIGRTNYEIANFWYEDFEHLLQTGVLQFPVQVKILEDGWAMIYDERVPTEFYSETSYRAPQEYWSLKQLMARQLKLDSGEIELVPYKNGAGYFERHKINAPSRKLDGNWTIQEMAPVVQMSEDAVVSLALAMAQNIDSTPIAKNSPGRKEANDLAERQNGK